MTEKQKNRNREIQKKVWENPELRKRHSQIHKGKHSSPKTEFKKGDKRLIGNKINVGRIPWNKGKKGIQVAWNKGKKGISEETRQKIIKSVKKSWLNPELQKRQSEVHKRIEQATRFKKGHEVSEDIKQKLRTYTLKQYESGDFPKQTNTLPEREIKTELIKRRYKEGTDFIHQYKFMNKFMCDFCFPEPKVVVEVYGDFWHGNPIKYAGKKLHKHQIKGINRDKSKEAYITKVDNHSWTYFVLWEGDIKKDITKCVDRIEEVLKKKKNKILPQP